MKLMALTGAGISVGSGLMTFAESEIDWRKILDRKYANKHPEWFAEDFADFCEPIIKAKPCDAHYALAEYDVPVITANVDRLHKMAGSKTVFEIHGYVDSELDDSKITLYGDLPADDYGKASTFIQRQASSRDLLVIGTSLHTNTLQQLIYEYSMMFEHGRIFVIDKDSEFAVRKFLELYISHDEGFLEYCEEVYSVAERFPEVFMW